MHVYLETERMVLRRFTADDVDLIVDLDSDPEVMRYLSGGEPTPREEVRNEIIPAWLSYYDRGDDFGYWAAVDKARGGFLGWFHFRPHPDGDRDGIELGYRLRRAAWGRGLATEGSRALIAKGFTTLGVHRVFAETMTVNTASRRVMEKSGLRYIRTFHQPWPTPIPGDEHGEVEYAITRAEWQASR
ncbi:GNAT family N-acetyltransferase [Actinokineospora sp. NPDC004072]